MVTSRYYAKQGHADIAAALPDIVRFLIDDHPTITGPGWTIIEAQTGSNREIPPSATNLDSLVSATGWHDGTLAINDWIVLESANGNNTNHFQLYIEYQSASQINFLMIPLVNGDEPGDGEGATRSLEPFVTGGGASSPPTFPNSGFGTTAVSPTAWSWTTFSHFSWYTLIADEGMFLAIADGSKAGIAFTYIGEVNGIEARDPRAFIMRSGGSIGHSASGYVRLSAADNLTKIAGLPIQPGLHISGGELHKKVIGRMFDVDIISPAGMIVDTTNNEYFVGWFRYLYAGRLVTNNGIVMSPDRKWLFVCATTTSTALVIKWNGDAY